MTEQTNKNDPRVLRTRQLIIDAFYSLNKEKIFKDITIGAIAERATINRGTFYSHFTDIYDLMEYIIIDLFMNIVYKQLPVQEELTAETLRNLIISLCNYHGQLSENCRRTAKAVLPLIEIKVKDKLEEILSGWMIKSIGKPKIDKTIQWAAVMVSHSIYSASYIWNANGRETSVEVFADELLCFLMPELQAVIRKEI